MPLVADAFDELLTLAVPPLGVVDDQMAPAGAVGAPAVAPVVSIERVLEHALRDARATAQRLAVCVVEPAEPFAPAESSTGPQRLRAWVQRHLRTSDRLSEEGTLVVVASGLHHACEAERLAARIRRCPADWTTRPIVGLAIFPTHGDDAATLLEQARASATRARTQPLPEDMPIAAQGGLLDWQIGGAR